MGQSLRILSYRFDRISSWLFLNLQNFLTIILTQCCNSLGGLVVFRSQMFDLRIVRGGVTVWMLLNCLLFDRFWLLFMVQVINKLLFLIFKLLFRLWLVSTWLQKFGSLFVCFVFSMNLIVAFALAIDCAVFNCMIVFGRGVLLSDIQCGRGLVFCETLLWLSITFGVICLILLALKGDYFGWRKSYFLSNTRASRQWQGLHRLWWHWACLFA